jgi:hypothetical protein
MIQPGIRWSEGDEQRAGSQREGTSVRTVAPHTGRRRFSMSVGGGGNELRAAGA